MLEQKIKDLIFEFHVEIDNLLVDKINELEQRLQKLIIDSDAYTREITR